MLVMGPVARRMRLAAKVGIRVAALTLAAGALMSATDGPPTPADSPLTMQDVLSSAPHRDLMTPKLAVGDPAFPFTLPRLDLRRGDPRPTGKSVSLASFQGRKPVALIFGSYS